MAPRIGLVHALHASIAPIEATFARMWPEAETVSLYDESLYVDFNKAGGMNRQIEQRIEALLRFSAESGAEAILFTGSLFGSTVESARARLDVPGAHGVRVHDRGSIRRARARQARPAGDGRGNPGHDALRYRALRRRPLVSVSTGDQPGSGRPSMRCCGGTGRNTTSWCSPPPRHCRSATF